MPRSSLIKKKKMRKKAEDKLFGEKRPEGEGADDGRVSLCSKHIIPMHKNVIMKPIILCNELY